LAAGVALFKIAFMATLHKFKITSQAGYSSMMKEIDTLMKKGEDNLSSVELKKLRGMAEAAEAWEDASFTVSIPRPKTITEMIELKMFEMKINQVRLAEIIEIDTPKLSQILNGRRKPDVAFLKAVHKKLKIDPAFLLEKALL
jgi:HTH-type transcriptional regulator / antitoxin HigA